jgi:hypothetical protein
MIKKLLPLLFLTCFTAAYADIHTGVLVVGGGASGVAAGIQSARSKVKTMIVEPTPWLGGEMTAGGMCILEGNRSLPSGIWGEFRKHVRDFYKHMPGFDTSATAPLKFEPYTGSAVLKKICDTVKNLTVHLNTPFVNVRKDGNGWEVDVILNGKPATIKAKAVVDATPLGDVAAKAGVQMVSGFDSRKDTREALAPENASPIIEDVTWVAIVKEFARNTIYLMPKPDDYDPARYVCLQGKDIKKMLEAGRIPNDKYMIKWAECANTYGATVDDLSPEHREAFYKKMRLHTLGLVYYIQNELGFKNIGIDDREFNSPDHLPYVPYIREYRRAKGLVRMDLNHIYSPYADNLYRTSIGVGDASFGQHYADPAAPKTDYPPLPAYTIPLGSVVASGVTNLIVTEKAMSTTHLTNASTFYPSVQMTVGQGAGTVAAYCAFFDKTTKELNVRAIQVELLDFKGFLFPYADVQSTDKYFRSIQQITATGLLKADYETKGKTVQMLFKPDSTVNVAQVKPVFMDIYTRAFVWFGKEKPEGLFTVANMLSYISDVTLMDPKTLQQILQSQWRQVYNFKQPFDMKRSITRYEFAVLANKYINPFTTAVDMNGKLTN